MKFYDYDPADALKTPEAIAYFVGDALETGDAGYIANAIGAAARAKGMTKVAKASGLAREQLYKSLSAEGNPTLTTILAVIKALGLELTIKSAETTTGEKAEAAE
jgi:probable addiction module antidote protein